MQPVIANLTFEDHVRNCFIAPCKPKELPGDLFDGLRPTLHLLRRDLELLYRPEAVQYERDGLKPPFLVLTGMMTGFDLMSNLYWGEEELSEETRSGNAILKAANHPKRLSEIGSKFRRFLSEVGGMDATQVKILWNLRGAVVHSYALAFRDEGFEDFEISVDEPGALLGYRNKRYTINLWALKKEFLRLVAEFKLRLSSPDERLESTFTNEMIQRGYIFVAAERKRPV